MNTSITLGSNIKDIVQKIEDKFIGINIEVYYSDISDTYTILVPQSYFNNSEFSEFMYSIDMEMFLNDVTNYYITEADEWNHEFCIKELEPVYILPQLEFA